MQRVLNNVPLIPMRGIVALPGEASSFDVGRPMSVKAIEKARAEGGHIVLLCQKDPRESVINEDNLFLMGSYCEILNVESESSDVRMKVTAGALNRVRILNFIRNEEYFSADVEIITDAELESEKEEKLKNKLVETINRLKSLNSFDMRMNQIKSAVHEPCGRFCDIVAVTFMDKFNVKQQVLETIDIYERVEIVCGFIINECKLIEVDKHIEEETKKNIDKGQKEYYLREKIATIRHELGDDSNEEIENMRYEAEKKNLPEHVKARLNKEIKRLESLPFGSHDVPAVRALIECILELPWTEKTDDIIDIDRARQILDRDHYGMKKVKDRVIEYLAVSARTGSLNGQIICLVGPPGVGKTSIVASIAEAVGRNFVRMSLGGIDDEAEIRGHRRTYIGAMPGRIIAAMRQAKTINPVILFDEIDKLNKNIHGDPAAAMLEVLDSAQNNSFRDHFLEIPYDLSHVMFITTANSLDTIPRPLLDRMEVIEVPGYMEYEKVQIAARHLIPQQFEKHGLTQKELTIHDDAIAELIRGYTRESGVRSLDRVLASVCRNAAYELQSGKARLTLTHTRIQKYLGSPKYSYSPAEQTEQVGTVTGLAWTTVGGETLEVEVLPIAEGTGKLELTGSLGDVMRESARTALTYVKAHAKDYGVDSDYFGKHDIHIHVPEGAVPKDGPSAGITIMTAIMSAVSNTPVKARLAMTGEITLRGTVLKIGGLREKLLAAIRAGIKTALVPLDNKADIDELEDEIKKNISIFYVSNAKDVLDKALSKGNVIIPRVADSLRAAAE